MRSGTFNGVLLSMLMLAAGVAAAGIAWWNNLSHTNQALAFWGPEAAVLVRDAPQVTAFELDFEASGEGRSSDNEEALVDPRTGDPVEVLRVADISHAKGLVHLRHALLDDRSFDWTSLTGGDAADRGELRYALAFQRDGRRLVVFFPRDFAWLVTRPPVGAATRSVSTEPIAQGLKKYVAEVLPGEEQGHSDEE